MERANLLLEVADVRGREGHAALEGEVPSFGGFDGAAVQGVECGRLMR